MRVGDFGVDVVPHGRGNVRELESGHVLARPGQVYQLRLRNYGPLHCVVDVDLDGSRVTAGGLVLAPWSVTELERPIDAGEDGRFTVIAEGNEAVFGPDGGRDNAQLGLIEARFRRELPRHDRQMDMPPTILVPNESPTRPLPGISPSRFPREPEWSPTFNRASFPPGISASASRFFESFAEPSQSPEESVERAAGSGLTGHSSQRFVPMSLGPLETEATVIRLRLVIGSEAAIAEDAARPLVDHRAPARPAARP